jgi:hypothetical protein
LIHPLEFFDGLMLGGLGVAIMAGKVRGIDAALPGNVIASLIYIAVGCQLISGRAIWPQSERRVMWAWISLLVIASLLYGATNFL